MGWELKAHTQSVITLMTPQPDGGLHAELGAREFISRFGHPREDGTIYYTGITRVAEGKTYSYLDQEETRHLAILGYDYKEKKITDVNGCIAVIDHGETLETMLHKETSNSALSIESSCLHTLIFSSQSFFSISSKEKPTCDEKISTSPLSDANTISYGTPIRSSACSTAPIPLNTVASRSFLIFPSNIQNSAIVLYFSRYNYYLALKIQIYKSK